MSAPRPALPSPSTVFGSPGDNTATTPPERRGLRRDGVRLLVADARGISHRQFRDLPGQLRAGDLLVVNNSATCPGEVDGRAAGRGPMVVHVASPLGGPGFPSSQWVAELRTAPDAARPILDGRAGEVIVLPAGVRLRLVAPYPDAGSSPTGRGNRLWRVQVIGTADLRGHLAVHGRPIAYGYLSGRFGLDDYQTVFASIPGSAEMPSAGRPFTPELITRLLARGIAIAPITLHTGVSSQDAGEAPQPEFFDVSAATATLVNATRSAGGRVVAVGTTATRALESAASPDGTVSRRSGWTELVITGERGVWVVDGLITGWHNPEASHLLLVEAVVGRRLTQLAYDAAVARRYLWHEFGDAGLLLAR